MASVHSGFFLTKNLPAAPDVFLIHFWQVEKRCVTERKTSQGQQVAVSVAGGAGRDAVAVQELCVLPTSHQCSQCRDVPVPAGLGSLLCPGGLQASHGDCLQHNHSSPIAPSRDAPAHRGDGQAAVTT